jgi:hypothetical protein
MWGMCKRLFKNGLAHLSICPTPTKQTGMIVFLRVAYHEFLERQRAGYVPDFRSDNSPGALRIYLPTKAAKAFYPPQRWYKSCHEGARFSMEMREV